MFPVLYAPVRTDKEVERRKGTMAKVFKVDKYMRFEPVDESMLLQ